MEVTDVRVFLVDDEKLKAFVSVVFDNCFAVSDIKIISGQNGRFLSMPSKKRKNGSFKDIAHPLDNETRKRLEEVIFRRYDEAVQSGAPRATGTDSEPPAIEEGDLPTRPSPLDVKKYLP